MAEEPAKIKIKNLDTNEELTVQYNPPEYTLSKGAQISEIAIPGLDSPLLQFIRGTNERLTLRLFFDTTDEGTDVREKTKHFYKLAKINSDIHAVPRCRISWGKSGRLKGDNDTDFNYLQISPLIIR